MSKKKIDLVKQELELYLSNPSLTMDSKGWTKAQYDEIIEDLEQKIENSKRGRSSKNKGANYERSIAKVFKDKLEVELKRTPQSGGFAKDTSKGDEFRGDIVSIDDTIDFNLHIECKNHKSWSILAWLNQAIEDCPKDKIPVVIYHKRNTSKDYVAINLNDFIELLKES